MIRSPIPFTLILSKGGDLFSRTDEGQGFDGLSPNGAVARLP